MSVKKVKHFLPVWNSCFPDLANFTDLVQFLEIVIDVDVIERLFQVLTRGTGQGRMRFMGTLLENCRNKVGEGDSLCMNSTPSSVPRICHWPSAQVTCNDYDQEYF